MGKAALKIQLLGGFQVYRSTNLIKPPQWRTAKNRALLAILVSERGRIFTQEELIERLWPEAEPGKATATLRKRVSELRRILEPALKRGSQSRYILTVHHGYCFNPRIECRIDAEEFAAHYERGREEESKKEAAKAIQEYEQAVKLYRGEYLPECRYEDWARPQRQEYQEIYLDLLSRLAECYAQLGRYRRAITYCKRALSIRNYSETIYRQLMLYHYLMGDQAAALRTYEKCRKALKEQLGVEPGPETKELYEQIFRCEPLGIDKDYKPLPILRHPVPYSPGHIPFVGREKEYGLLMRHLKEAGIGQGRLVMIAGEAGVGKTRLVQELLNHAQTNGALVLQGRCHEREASRPYQPLADAIRNGLSYLSQEVFASIDRPWLAAVAELVLELRNIIARLPHASPLPPEQERQRLFEGMVQFFQALAGSAGFEKPLVLFLDDLHRALLSTLDFLNYLLPRLRGQPILVLGAHRSGEVGEEHPLLELEGVYRLHLSPLSYPAIIQLFERSFPSLSPSFCHHLYQKTEGNPLFIVAVLQSLLEERALKTTEDGDLVTTTDDIDWGMIPPQVAELIQRRLERLSDEELEILKLAAVVGRSFDLDLLKEAWARSEKEILDLLNHLREAHLLIVGSDGKYDFSHGLICEVVKAGIGSERQGLHWRIGVSIERLYRARGLEAVAPELAGHFYQGGEWGKALDYSIEALRRAVKECRNEEGLQLADLGLKATAELEEGGETGERRYEILKLRSTILDLMGRREEQARDIENLFGLAEQLDDNLKRAEAHEIRSRYYFNLGRYEESKEEAFKGLKLRRRSGDKRGEGRALNLLGDVYRASSESAKASECFEQPHKILKDAGDKRGEAMALNNMGVIYRRLGEYQKALSCFEQAHKMRRQMEDRREEAQILANIGNVYWALGKPLEALREYKKTHEILKTVGDGRGEGMILFNLGLVYSDIGKYTKALSCYERAYRIFKEVGDKNGGAATLSDMGMIYAELGEYSKALGSFEQAHQTLAEVGDSHRLGLTLNNLGNLHLRLEEHKKALQYFRQAYQLREELGDRRRQALDLSGVGAAHLGLGEYHQALECFEQALELIEELEVETLKIELLSRKSLVHLDLGDRSEALRCSREAVRLLEEGESGAIEHPEEIYFNHFKVLQASGGGEPLAILEKAYDEVMRKANNISARGITREGNIPWAEDEALRRNFLAKVRVNREIVEVWEKRTG